MAQLLRSPIALMLIAFICGALQVFSFAPFSIWPLGFTGLVAFCWLLKDTPRKSALLRIYAFGFGLFLAGTHWIFVSIHEFGGASVLLAGAIVILFTAFLALVFTLPFYIALRFFSFSSLQLLFLVPCIWFLGEWSRTWFLTGFPWLFSGYGYLSTPLSGYVPIIGVSGVSLLVMASAAITAYILGARTPSKLRFGLLGILGVIWLAGYGLTKINWTQLEDKPIRVGMIQPNVDQSIKLNWNYEAIQQSLSQLREQSDGLWDKNDWIIWPEAAIPTALTFHTALPFIEKMNSQAAQHQAALFTGVIYDDRQTKNYYNSIVGLGDGLGFYHKRRLVPFGEYVPLEEYLRGFIELFDLPTSYINLGPKEQHGLIAHGVRITPAVCYEIVYPDLIATSAKETQVLLNINNLGWFLDSLQSKQFLQMAQMRALETGRYLIYSTNNGPSALIDNKGKILAQSQAFTDETLEGVIYPAIGTTPFMHLTTTGLACFVILLLCLWYWFSPRINTQTRET